MQIINIFVCFVGMFLFRFAYADKNKNGTIEFNEVDYTRTHLHFTCTHKNKKQKRMMTVIKHFFWMRFMFLFVCKYKLNCGTKLEKKFGNDLEPKKKRYLENFVKVLTFFILKTFTIEKNVLIYINYLL